MKLTLDLLTDVSIALRKASFDLEESIEASATTLLRETLIALGHLESRDLDEDSEVEGTA